MTEVFKVVERRDLSIEDLSNKAASGEPVMKTPHVGNWRIDNMIWLDPYILNLAYDRNLGRKDTNFYPHGLIINGKFKPVVREDILSTHSSLREVHMETLRSLKPDARLETSTSYINDNLDLFKMILEIVGEDTFELGLWKRKVTSDGKTRLVSPVSWDAIKKEGIFGIDNPNEGWLWSNELNILMFTVVDALNYGADKVHHISGPDMFKYIGQMKNTLNKLYAILADKKEGLPAKIQMDLHVAGSFNRFAVPEDKRDNLDSFVELLRELNNAAKEKSKRARQAAKEGKNVQRVIASLQSKERKLFDLASEALKPIYRYLVYETAIPHEGAKRIFLPSYYSQHDAVEKGLYIHEVARASSQSDIEHYYNLLLKLYRNISR